MLNDQANDSYIISLEYNINDDLGYLHSSVCEVVESS